MKLLIDGDIITFRAAFSAEPPNLIQLLSAGIPEEDALENIKEAEENGCWIACSRADAMIEEIVATFGCSNDDVEVWLSGPKNFRYSVYPEYKANRITAKRPRWEQQVKEHLVHQWGAEWSQGCEADDMLGVRQHQLKPQEWTHSDCDPIICTIDKDLDQIVGWHYNFVKKEKYYVTPEEATRFFYYQLLVGDTADGIKGVPGIGPVKAKKLLDACYEEAAHRGVDVERLYYEAVLDRFSCYEEFEMNAKVLWIWRKEGEMWSDKYKTMDTSPEEGLYNLSAEERH